MKKILPFLILTLLSISIYAQRDPTKEILIYFKSGVMQNLKHGEQSQVLDRGGQGLHFA